MPLLKTEWQDPTTGTMGWLVIDRLVDGLAGGGVRMRPGLGPEEVTRLAEIMTLKLKVLGLQSGGAKAGVDKDPRDPDALDVLGRFLQAHRPFLAEMWSTSEDLGTREADILHITRAMGLSSSVHAALMRTADPEKASQRLMTVLALHIQGLPMTDVVTGYGVAQAARYAADRLGMKIRQATVAIQGFGTVGGGAALFLAEAGAVIAAVADAEGILCAPRGGFHIPDLLSIRNGQGVIERSRLPSGTVAQAGGEWAHLPVDILIPAAVPDAIDGQNVQGVQARLVIEGANAPISPSAEVSLQSMGVTVIPDFIANAGGAGLFAAAFRDDVPTTSTAVLGFLEDMIGGWTDRVMAACPPHKTVRKVARDLLDGNL